MLNTDSILLLCLGALALAVIAVLLDRVNFPQRRFKAKQIRVAEEGPARDRTGAHIVDIEPPEQLGGS